MRRLLAATRVLAGAGGKPYVPKLGGVLHDAGVIGIYQDARCRYRTALHTASS